MNNSNTPIAQPKITLKKFIYTLECIAKTMTSAEIPIVINGKAVDEFDIELKGSAGEYFVNINLR